MKPLMYKQRPAVPALIAAACVLAFGTALIFWLRPRVEVGEAEVSSVLLAGCMTCGITGGLLVSAFARYQFTHLWKKPHSGPTKKPPFGLPRDPRR